MATVMGLQTPFAMFALFVCVTAAYDCCRTVDSLQGRALAGHVIQVYLNKRLETCTTLCDSNELCLSINYSHDTQRCELNERNLHTNPGDWVPMENTIHLENLHRRDHPCVHSLCQHGGRCVSSSSLLSSAWSSWASSPSTPSSPSRSSSSLPSYTCHCQGGYTGNFCQECANSPGTPVGMESGSIPDEYITASTSTTDGLPSYGRLNNPMGWRAQAGDTGNPYFQVRFKVRKLVVSLATQGVREAGNYSAVARYYLSYGDDGKSWTDYQNTAHKEHFTGNDESTPIKRHTLKNPFIALLVRILPTNWKRRPALRMEVYGCDAEN